MRRQVNERGLSAHAAAAASPCVCVCVCHRLGMTPLPLEPPGVATAPSQSTPRICGANSTSRCAAHVHACMLACLLSEPRCMSILFKAACPHPVSKSPAGVQTGCVAAQRCPCCHSAAAVLRSAPRQLRLVPVCRVCWAKHVVTKHAVRISCQTSC